MKAVISTKEAYGYVGNQMIWKELMVAYGSELLPIRTAPRGDQFWHVVTIDDFLLRAQFEGVLRCDAA